MATLADPAPPLAAPRSRVPTAVWVTTLYLAMGVPFNLVNGTAASMMKALGLSDAAITLALGNIIVAWSLKPLWAGFLGMAGSKRGFVLGTQAVAAAACVGVALAVNGPGWFAVTVALLWVMAFASATHDICADGVYLTSVPRADQARYAGFQSMAWNLGRVVATGLIVTAMELAARDAGWGATGMWTGVWLGAAALMAGLAAFHARAMPPGSANARAASPRAAAREVVRVAAAAFDKRALWGMLAYILLYRLGEGLLITEGRLFLQSSRASGGLGLTPGEVALIDSTWGTLATVAGGVLGGLWLHRRGLTRSIPLFALVMNVPHLSYVYLSQMTLVRDMPMVEVGLWVGIEKFGYGFGMVSNVVYIMQQFAPGRTTMTHYAFGAALMALMLVPTTMISGPLAESLGYQHYFLFVMLASIPSVWVALRAPLRLDPARLGGVDAPEADDAERLPPDARAAQRAAGRASAWVLAHVLLLMTLDANLLGAALAGTWSPGAIAAAGAAGLAAKLVAMRETRRWLTRLPVGAGLAADPFRENARGARRALALAWSLTLALGAAILWRLA